MKRIFFLLLVIVAVMAMISCGGSGNSAKPNEVPKILKTSAPNPPDWILKKKKTDDTVYFIGMSSKSPDLKEARKASIDDAASQLVEYIGFRATSKFQSKKSIQELDNITSFRQDVVQTLEGKGSANVAIDVEDVYYEYFSDNTYTMYTLIKFPQSWIDKERARLQKLVDDQRSASSAYMSDANSSLLKGDISKALDLSINALFISEKAAENSDIYDESRNMIILLLSGLTFSLDNTPKYAFTDGGSDPVIVKAQSSKTGTGVSGLQLTAYETSSNANIDSKTGTVTDGNGKVTFESGKIVKTGTDKLYMVISYSIKKFEDIQKIDMELYNQIVELQQSQALHCPLSVVIKGRIIPTTIAVVDSVISEKKVQERGLALKFQEQVAGKLANKGFNIMNIEIPAEVMDESNDSAKIKNILLTSIREKNPSVKRLLMGIREVDPIGKLGEDIKFSNYDLNDSGLQIVNMKFILSLIDIDSGKVEKSVTLSSKGQGLNISQAIETAEKKTLEKLDEQINEFN